MPGESGRAIVHLVEPQHLFVQALVDVFTEAGLNVDYVAASVDPRRTLDDRPDLIFLDTDFLTEPLESVRLIRLLAPQAVIASYTSGGRGPLHEAFISAGADVVMEKSAERRSIVQGLRDMEHRRRQRQHDSN
jgi:DNA-binding NarL/FixJ family response regulator